MLQTLDKVAEGISESTKFDDRNNFALSGGFLKPELKNNSLHYVEYKKLASLDTDKHYFQRRVEDELQLLHDNPKNEKLLLRVGDIYLANNKLDKAKIYYNRAFTSNMSSLTAAKRLVEIFLAKGKPEKADGVLELVQSKLDSSMLHLHAVIKLVQSKYGDAEMLAGQVPTTASNYYEAVNSLGLAKLNKSEYAEARKCFEKSINANKNYAPAKSNLALSLQKMGRIKESIKQYRLTIEQHHDYVVAYHNLFNLYVSKKKIQEAYQLMDSARDLVTPNNEIQFRIAWSLMELGRFDEAIEEYKKLLKLLPENSSTLNNIGHCYFKKGNDEQAYLYFDRATKASIRGDVVSVLPYRNLMIASERVRKISVTRQIATDLLKRFPDDLFALVVKGEELVDKEKWAQAYRTLLKAYEYKPDLVGLYTCLSLIYADIYPDYEKGKEVCEFALRSDMERRGEVINNLIHLHLVNGNVSEAEPLIKYLNTENPISLSTVALYHLQKGEIEKAKEMYDDAAKLAAKSFVTKVLQRKYYDVALYYMSEGDNEMAIENFERCLSEGTKGFQFITEKAKDFLNSLKATE